jgi:hypothetical protein
MLPCSKCHDRGSNDPALAPAFLKASVIASSRPWDILGRATLVLGEASAMSGLGRLEARALARHLIGTPAPEAGGQAIRLSARFDCRRTWFVDNRKD